MTSMKSIFLLGALLASTVCSQSPPTNLPPSAKCWAISYPAASIKAAGAAAKNLPLASVHEFPMAYPLSNMRYPAWDHSGGPFPKSGAPWAAGCDTSDMRKFPLVPHTLAGNGGQWDGTKSRSSDVGGGNEQSDFVFVDGDGRFCLVATETPYGVAGWLPCEF